jgi:hypothetical protein
MNVEIGTEAPIFFFWEYLFKIFGILSLQCGPGHGEDSDLKGHGNEADFLGFLQKLDPHRSLTVSFEPFRFWLRIRGDIRNRKTTPRLGESESRRLPDSASRGVDMVSRGVAIRIF